MEKEMNLIEELEKASLQEGLTFSELIVNLYKGKLIEIYCGDSYEDVHTDQITNIYPSVFCGKVIGSFNKILILDCIYINANKKMSSGKTVFLNERNIVALSEVDGSVVLEQLFLRGKSTLQLKDALK